MLLNISKNNYFEATLAKVAPVTDILRASSFFIID